MRHRILKNVCFVLILAGFRIWKLTFLFQFFSFDSRVASTSKLFCFLLLSSLPCNLFQINKKKLLFENMINNQDIKCIDRDVEFGDNRVTVITCDCSWLNSLACKTVDDENMIHDFCCFCPRFSIYLFFLLSHGKPNVKNNGREREKAGHNPDTELCLRYGFVFNWV